jgi:osmotically-inducible protein OsmY
VTSRFTRIVLRGLAAAAGAGVLAGCAPLLVGGAVVGGSIVATDRRTTGIQIEDTGIASRAETRAAQLATLGRINAHSYNRLVLLTGEVPSEADKAAVEAAVAQVENVRSVVNELAVGPNASIGQRSQDTLLEAKVKASLVDAKDVQANAYRVIASRGTVYLMGRVTQREADRGGEIARSVPGVQKVVRVLDILSEEELATLGRGTAPAASPAPTPAPAPPRQ